MPTAARLRVVRDRLLKLHKTLLDWERAQYEHAYGQVRSSGDMLQLVLGHDQFAWLRPYSGLIVRIDEWLVSDQPSRQDAEAFWEEADRLTTPGDRPSHRRSGIARRLTLRLTRRSRTRQCATRSETRGIDRCARCVGARGAQSGT